MLFVLPNLPVLALIPIVSCGLQCESVPKFEDVTFITKKKRTHKKKRKKDRSRKAVHKNIK